MTTYIEKLAAIQKKNASNVCLRLNPIPEFLPLDVVSRWDEPLLPFNKAIINATKSSVCAYQLSLAHYLHWGAAGAIALERTVGYIPSEVPIILDCRMSAADAALAGLLDGAFGWGADAVTLSEQVVWGDGVEQIKAFPSNYFYLLGTAPGSFRHESLVELDNVGFGLVKPQWRTVAGLRSAAPSANFLLMDGVGDAAPLVQYGRDSVADGVMSFGRKIYFASAGLDWAEACQTAVETLRVTLQTD